ncbi:DNA primase DNA G [Helicobacter cetorum MIT 99-5656]|uniref:DNA primase DNA G n=2 Tax=Helicobacter cetorum TaxID=138563 RepID=I0ETG8_HELCM|nr:DNA primase DNA G [Helicobacter cetorum MIT 99-5656]
MAYEFFNYNFAVCCLGTAFTKEHLFLLKKQNVEICFSLDNDKAGMDASIRAIELCLNYGFTNISVIKIKDKSYKDMGEFLEKNKKPLLTKTHAFKFYCAYLLRSELNTEQKDINYKRILKNINPLSPFMTLKIPLKSYCKV